MWQCNHLLIPKPSIDHQTGQGQLYCVCVWGGGESTFASKMIGEGRGLKPLLVTWGVGGGSFIVSPDPIWCLRPLEWRQ